MATGGINLHVVFLPYFIPGHTIPLVQLARIFAGRGVRSTIITTLKNALTFQPSIDRDIAAGNPINVHTITLASDEKRGTRATAEAVAAALRRDIMLLQPEMEQSIRDLAPDCIVSDMFFPWTVDLAHELKIPRLYFHPCNLFNESVIHSLKVHGPQNKVKSESESFVIPGLPDKITMKRSEVPEELKLKTSWSEIMEEIEQSKKRSYGLVYNTFYEIEPAYWSITRRLKVPV
ncbi:hypothetical protein OSB04_013890 [Centaurea solstitialis]|uniref:Uncharacterized protein n=1 Tax=Centaurea solstitialis TaxID=347529 RepID=A0AA38TS08_9ASTR|nr:hypothetical protein OSB04_013890 [Centaurea solstitialis]